jgi:hypothetical protein
MSKTGMIQIFFRNQVFQWQIMTADTLRRLVILKSQNDIYLNQLSKSHNRFPCLPP